MDLAVLESSDGRAAARYRIIHFILHIYMLLFFNMLYLAFIYLMPCETPVRLTGSEDD